MVMQDSMAHGSAPKQAEDFVVQRLTLRQLRVLLALADKGSISAAADALHVTQPAVSKTLSELESGLGQTLFVRRGRSIRATALCERLLLLARKLQADLRRGGEEVASLARGVSGDLLLGATNAALADLLPDAVTALKTESPGVAVSVRTHSLASMFDDLRQGRLDLVIARVQGTDVPADLERIQLMHQQEVLVISQCHPLATSRHLSWEVLAQQSWIWPLPGTRMRTLQDAKFHSLDLALPTNLFQTDDLMVTISMMRRMPLVGYLPGSIARVAAREGHVRILALENARLPLDEMCAWHMREPQGELVERFKQLLLAAAARLESET
ncbi:LysR substrate-binding domain-containing protein [Roseateles asaccharophilus]|uniref:DNA-binding transcriptional LysR family regulator n=1 Tax=Roseateles asaccharophilus TaxID=582607 RepID=A0ABU2ACD2_9BURK|nr:LysR substrate-binding domain-containing protein [Roseateles asaccharophilus]MDR7334862.1 DNA-binding transcriptional LysR family regulator [Roseateles asaccharophilus]